MKHEHHWIPRYRKNKPPRFYCACGARRPLSEELAIAERLAAKKSA